MVNDYKRVKVKGWVRKLDSGVRLGLGFKARLWLGLRVTLVPV